MVQPLYIRTECNIRTDLCRDGDGLPEEQPEPSIRTTCFACGLPACKDCTIILPTYHRWRRKRVCLDCLPQQGYGQEAANHMWKVAYGFDGEPTADFVALYIH